MASITMHELEPFVFPDIKLRTESFVLAYELVREVGWFVEFRF